MELLLSNELTIKEVNKNFQKKFPYLKLEFYTEDYVPGQTSLWDDRLPDYTKLGQIIGNFLPTFIQFELSDTVSTFRKRFLGEMGLHVQVFKKTNDMWQDTFQSDYLSLEKENILGARRFQLAYNIHTLFL